MPYFIKQSKISSLSGGSITVDTTNLVPPETVNFWCVIRTGSTTYTTPIASVTFEISNTIDCTNWVEFKNTAFENPVVIDAENIEANPPFKIRNKKEDYTTY